MQKLLRSNLFGFFGRDFYRDFIIYTNLAHIAKWLMTSRIRSSTKLYYNIFVLQLGLHSNWTQNLALLAGFKTILIKFVRGLTCSDHPVCIWTWESSLTSRGIFCKPWNGAYENGGFKTPLTLNSVNPPLYITPIAEAMFENTYFVFFALLKSSKTWLLHFS